MKNYVKTNIGNEGRVELHETLGLTGAEVYGILSGKGSVVLDGETVPLTAGDWLKVSPAAKRQFSAAADTGMAFVCIQVKEHSLAGFTAADAVVY